MVHKIARRWFWLIVAALAPLAVPLAYAGGDSAGVQTGASSLGDRVERLEARLREVESEVVELRRENRTLQANLSRHGRGGTITVESHPAVANAGNGPSQDPQTSAEDQPGPYEPSSQWGLRVGYQGFPFGQKEGGFFYSFFFDHPLLSPSEEPPFGDLAGEFAVGVGRSGIDHVNVFSPFLGKTEPVEFRQVMLSGWPSLKYSINRWAQEGIRPYIIGGAGIWGDIIESPPLFIGQQPQGKQLIPRKLPVNAAASIFEGGQGGAGLDFSLARTGVPMLEHVNIGFDYRYSAWTSGERFSSYGFSLSSSE